MLFAIVYLLFSLVFMFILFHLIEHAPTGWEDESGFHAAPKAAPILNNPVNQHTPNTEIIFGNVVARYHTGN
jgi:hypothetical protein